MKTKPDPQWSQTRLSASAKACDGFTDAELLAFGDESLQGMRLKGAIAYSNALRASAEAELDRLRAQNAELRTLLARVLEEIGMTEAGMAHVAPLTLEQARAAIAKAEQKAD